MSNTPHLPFNNLRYLLSLHAKTDGERTAVIYDVEHDRHKTLSYMELNARAHQTANLLYDDLGVRRGDCIAITASNTPDTLCIMLACWILGVRVLRLNASLDDDQLIHQLSESQAILYAVDDGHIARVSGLVDELAMVQAVLHLGDMERDDSLHFGTLVQNLPTTFLGDDAPVKSDDDRIAANPSETVASLDDGALVVYAEGQAITWTQRDLLRKVGVIAQAQAFTGGQRVLDVTGEAGIDAMLFGVMMSLLVGGSMVLDTQFSAEAFWEQVVEARVHVVHIAPTQLEALLAQAERTQETGKGLFGEKVIRQRLTHFRHFVCTSADLEADLIRRFEDTFGLPIITGYIAPSPHSMTTLLPINLSWDEHQGWLLNHGTPSVGCAIDGDMPDRILYWVDRVKRRYYFRAKVLS